MKKEQYWLNRSAKISSFLLKSKQIIFLKMNFLCCSLKMISFFLSNQTRSNKIAENKYFTGSSHDVVENMMNCPRFRYAVANTSKWYFIVHRMNPKLHRWLNACHNRLPILARRWICPKTLYKCISNETWHTIHFAL